MTGSPVPTRLDSGAACAFTGTYQERNIRKAGPMSATDRAEGVAFLRRLVAGGPAERRAPRLRLGAAGFSLDRLLGGGLRADGLHEIVAAGAGDGAAASAFALALAGRALAAAPGALLWAGEDFVVEEFGALYGPGLAAQGVDPARLVLVRAPRPRETLWALEEALRSGAPAVVLGETGAGASLYGLSASRRLTLAARAGGRPCLLLRRAPGESDFSSAAETRFRVAARPGAALPPAGGRLPLPGAPVWGVRLVRARAAAAGLDAERVWPVRFDGPRGVLRDDDRPPLSLPLDAASGRRAADAADGLRRAG